MAVSIKTTNVNGDKITCYQHPYIKDIIRVINIPESCRTDIILSKELMLFIKAIKDNAVGVLTIHRDEKDELVLSDKFGHTFHIFNENLYMRKYPSPQNLEYDVLSSLARYYWKNDEWRNLETLSNLLQKKRGEWEVVGFPFYGDLWECEDELAPYPCETIHIAELTEKKIELSSSEWIDDITFVVTFTAWEDVDNEGNPMLAEVQAEYHHDSGKIVSVVCYYDIDGNYQGNEDANVELSSKELKEVRKIVIKELAKSF